MGKPPLVSVVIPSYGRPEYLARAITSVLAQDYPRLEVLVVDDNGLGTHEQMQTKEAVSDFLLSGVRYLPNRENQGGGFSRNVGVGHAAGEFVAFLDDDDEWAPNFLSVGVAKLVESGCDVVYCDCWIVDSAVGFSNKLEVNKKYSGDVWSNLLSGWCPSSTSLFILRRALAEGLDLFDVNLKGFQDYDCWLSLSRRARFTYHNVPAVYKYRHQLEQITKNTTARRESLLYLEEKWMPILHLADERFAFRNTVSKLGNTITLTDYKLALQRKKFKVAIKYSCKYMIESRMSPRAMYNIFAYALKSMF